MIDVDPAGVEGEWRSSVREILGGSGPREPLGVMPLAAVLAEIASVADLVATGGAPPFEGDRKSLIDDAFRAIEATRGRLQGRLAAVLPPFRKEIVARLSALLDTGRGARQARAAATALLDELIKPDVVVTVWQDVLSAVERDESMRNAAHAVAQLRAITELRGLDWEESWRRLPAFREGDEALDRYWTSAPPPVAFVWVAFANASLDRFYRRIGQIQFFDYRLWPDGVRNNESLRRLPGFVFPPELNNEELLAALDLPDEFRDSVLARVEFAGEFVHPEARPEARRLPAIEFARDLASGVVEAATFRIGGSAWKLLTGAVAVDPGDAVVATRTFDDPDRLHAVRSFIPPFRERTGEALEFIEERFVTDLARGVPAAAAVLDDVRWYEAAKRSPSQAQRLALYVRAVERALPIAEDESWATVVERYLCEFWAFDELTNQIALVGHDVFRSLQRVDHEVLAKIPPIVVDEPDLRFRVHFPPLLENVDDLLMALEGHADLERRVLRDLQQDVASSAAVAAWLRRLRGTFVQLLRRSLRQRNAIIHGGAVAPATVASVEPFVADIAALVVANAVYALEQGKRLEDEFERERFDGLLRLEGLERGVTTLDQLLAPAVAEQEGVARE